MGREGRGGEKKKIDGANNQPAEEMPQEMMGCNCGGAELSTKTKELSDKLCKTEGGFIRPLRGGEGRDRAREARFISPQPCGTGQRRGWSRGQNAGVIVTEW